MSVHGMPCRSSSGTTHAATRHSTTATLAFGAVAPTNPHRFSEGSGLKASSGLVWKGDVGESLASEADI